MFTELANCWIKLAGVWVLTDATYSITLYLNAPSYQGSSKQTWKRDHWVRIIRAIIGIAMILWG